MSVVHAIALAPYHLSRATLRLVSRAAEAVAGPAGYQDRSWELEYARAAVHARVEQRGQASRLR